MSSKLRYFLIGCHRDFRQPAEKSKNEITNKIIELSFINRLADGSIALGILFLKYISIYWQFNNNMKFSLMVSWIFRNETKKNAYMSIIINRTSSSRHVKKRKINCSSQGLALEQNW